MTEPKPGPRVATPATCPRCGVTYIKVDGYGRTFEHACQGTPTTRQRPSRPSIPLIPQEVLDAERDPTRVVNQYILVRQVGRGGMGTVWKAFDRKLFRTVAIKFLAGGSDAEIQRFRREAQMSASVRHPNIAGIYEIAEAGDRHFIALEYVDGAALDKFEAPLRDLVEIMRLVALAVEAAHKAGVVHRDLKPQNIMVTAAKMPYVLDFGLAKQVAAGQSLSMTGEVLGTPAYMSPEQAQGRIKAVDARSDVYSLGATLFWVVTRQPPFKGDSPMSTIMKVISDDPVHPSKLRPDCPEDLATIILKCMEKEPQRRYQTAAEIAEDLRRFLGDEPLIARPPSVAYRIGRVLHRNKVALSVAAIIMLAIGVVAYRELRGRATTGPDVGGFLALWGPASRTIAYLDFRDAVDPDAFDAAFAKLAEIAPRQIPEVARWFDDEARAREGDLGRWRGERRLWIENREEERKIAAWSKQVEGVLARLVKRVPAAEFAPLPARFASLGTEAASMAAYRGQATVRILVTPYATLSSMRSDGLVLVENGRVVPGPDVTFPDPDLSTPLALVDLEIRDYEIVLEHPDYGRRTLRIPADQLENGREYVITGSMENPESITLK